MKDEVTAFLREAGVVEVTDVSLEGFRGGIDEEETGRLARLADKADAAIRFLDPYVKKPSFAERLRGGPMRVSPAEVEKTLAEVDVEKRRGALREFESSMRKMPGRARLEHGSRARARAVAVHREPPRDPFPPPDTAFSSGRFPRRSSTPRSRRPTKRIRSSSMRRSPARGRRFTPASSRRAPRPNRVAELLKQAGAVRNAFEGLSGTPADIIEKQKSSWAALEANIARDRGRSARALARAPRASGALRSLPRTARASRGRAAFPPHGAHLRARGVDAGDRQTQDRKGARETLERVRPRHAAAAGRGGSADRAREQARRSAVRIHHDPVREAALRRGRSDAAPRALLRPVLFDVHERRRVRARARSAVRLLSLQIQDTGRNAAAPHGAFRRFAPHARRRGA